MRYCEVYIVFNQFEDDRGSLQKSEVVGVFSNSDTADKCKDEDERYIIEKHSIDQRDPDEFETLKETAERIYSRLSDREKRALKEYK